MDLFVKSFQCQKTIVPLALSKWSKIFFLSISTRKNDTLRSTENISVKVFTNIGLVRHLNVHLLFLLLFLTSYTTIFIFYFFFLTHTRIHTIMPLFLHLTFVPLISHLDLPFLLFSFLFSTDTSNFIFTEVENRELNIYRIYIYIWIDVTESKRCLWSKTWNMGSLRITESNITCICNTGLNKLEKLAGGQNTEWSRTKKKWTWWRYQKVVYLKYTFKFIYCFH